MPFLVFEHLLQTLLHSRSFTFQTLHFIIYIFLFLADAPGGLVLLFPPHPLPLHPPASSCLASVFLHTDPKVNRQHTIAHSTDSTVIQPHGQDLNQTSNNMLNQSHLKESTTDWECRALSDYICNVYISYTCSTQLLHSISPWSKLTARK